MKTETVTFISLSDLRNEVNLSEDFDSCTLEIWSFGDTSYALVSKDEFIDGCEFGEESDEVLQKLKEVIPDGCYVAISE